MVGTEREQNEDTSHKWGFGTWLLLLLILIGSSFFSWYLRNLTSSFLLYLPTSIAIVIIHWFGRKALILAYLNAVFTLILWEAPGSWDRILLLATREPLVIFTSWFFCKNLIRSSKGLSTTPSLVKFVVLGIIVPDFVNSLYTYHYTFINGDLQRVALLWLSDFITIFSISIPLLHFFNPQPSGKFFRLIPLDNEMHLEGKRIGVVELIAITTFFVGFSFVIDFDKYWFLYGIVACMVAIRNGFDTVILANIIIFVLNYILPLLNFGSFVHGFTAASQLLSVSIGMGTMFFASALIGRVITDLRKTEVQLIEQKSQIEKTNQRLTMANREMDRFVYSVSHDISAPLKSIKGLIAIGRLEKESFPYLNKIETSVQKLEDFIGEVLDHSRTSRKEVQHEDVNLNNLIADIAANLKYLENYSSIKFTIDLNVSSLSTDKFLIKVVIGNLLSNAIKYQKKKPNVSPEIKIESWKGERELHIKITDNGEGIAAPYKDKIFEMFYRGTTSSTGSGLGLFIAKEAVEKLHGKIEFTTEYGIGSEFTITLPV